MEKQVFPDFITNLPEAEVHFPPFVKVDLMEETLKLMTSTLGMVV